MSNYVIKVLAFNLKQNYFAIDVGVVSKISSVKTASMATYDNVNSIPIFKDLLANPRLHLAEKESEPSYIIIKNQFTTTSNKYKIIECDKVISVLSLDTHNLQEVNSYTQFKEYILGIYPFMDGYLTLLNTNRLLLSTDVVAGNF